MKGHYNVDVIHYDYYRDSTIALEAFKAGQYDVRREFLQIVGDRIRQSGSARRLDQKGGDPKRAV
jgi:ABC-type oligopeptide transport system substrate-binding subunit